MMKHLLRFLVVTLLVVLAFVVSPLPVFAQSGSANSDEVSLFVGSHLPSNIEGIKEVLPVFGARYGWATNRLGMVDLGFSNTHAKGVDFTNLSLSVRGSIPFDDGIVAMIYGGGDANWYSPENVNKRKLEGGFHFGTGAMVMATNSFWFRGDLKFMGGPGQNLFLLFGVVFQLDGFR